MISKIKFFFGLTIFCVLAVPSFSFASGIFSDNFESYGLVDLNGQNNWTSSQFQIENSVVHGGSQAVASQNATQTVVTRLATKVGAAQLDGQVSVYVRRDDNGMRGVIVR